MGYLSIARPLWGGGVSLLDQRLQTGERSAMYAPITTTMTARDWLLLVMLSLLWGGSFFFIEIAVPVTGPLTLVWLRVSLASALLWIIAFATGKRLPRDVHIWRSFFWMAVFNNMVPFTLISWGQTQIPSSLASILNATMPLFTVLVAHFFLADERASPRKLAGVAIGFVGVVVMIGPAFLGDIGGSFWGQLAVLGAALSYAGSGAYARRFGAMGLPQMVVAAGPLTMSCFLFAPVVLFLEQPFEGPAFGLAIWASVIALATISTSVAYIVFFYLLARVGTTNISLVTFLIPVSAILLGTVFLGERLGQEQIAGMTLILLGLLAIDGRVLRYMR